MHCTWGCPERSVRFGRTAAQVKEAFVAKETRQKPPRPTRSRVHGTPLSLLYKNPRPPVASAKFPNPAASLRTRLGTLAPATPSDPALLSGGIARPLLPPVAAFRRLGYPASSTRLRHLRSAIFPRRRPEESLGPQATSPSPPSQHRRLEGSVPSSIADRLFVDRICSVILLVPIRCISSEI